MTLISRSSRRDLSRLLRVGLRLELSASERRAYRDALAVMTGKALARPMDMADLKPLRYSRGAKARPTRLHGAPIANPAHVADVADHYRTIERIEAGIVPATKLTRADKRKMRAARHQQGTPD